MSNEEMKARVDVHTKTAETMIQKNMRTMAAVQKLHAIQEELDRSSQQVAAYVRELERLGETDANAGKIIQLAQILERQGTLLMVVAQSALDIVT